MADISNSTKEVKIRKIKETRTKNRTKTRIKTRIKTARIKKVKRHGHKGLHPSKSE